MKSRLFKMAWAVRSQFATFTEALVQAWKAIKLQCKLLTQAVVGFKYIKISDGSIREAKGTLETVPAVKGDNNKPKNYGVIVYFDIDAAAWRSFKVENLIG